MSAATNTGHSTRTHAAASGFRSLQEGMQRAGIGIEELWWRYISVGGEAELPTLQDYVNGAPCSSFEYNLVAQALNETFLDRGAETFPVAYRLDSSFSIQTR